MVLDSCRRVWRVGGGRCRAARGSSTELLEPGTDCPGSTGASTIRSRVPAAQSNASVSEAGGASATGRLRPWIFVIAARAAAASVHGCPGAAAAAAAIVCAAPAAVEVGQCDAAAAQSAAANGSHAKGDEAPDGESSASASDHAAPGCGEDGTPRLARGDQEAGGGRGQREDSAGGLLQTPVRRDQLDFARNAPASPAAAFRCGASRRGRKD